MKWIAPILAAVALALIYLYSPVQHGFYPRCLFHSLTGLDCPGCGSLRSIHYLLHGQLATAFRLNPLIYVLAPGIVLCRNHIHKPACLWSFVGVVIAFTIARNL